MKNIVVAAVIAASSICSPAILLVSSPAAAVDCSDPASPGNRPGGYCSLIQPGGTLIAPLSGGISCDGTEPTYKRHGSAELYIPKIYGERVDVAGIYCQPDPCRSEA